MSKLDEVQIIPRDLKADPRGWLLKVLTGTEDHLGSEIGEIYLTLAQPGQARGNHYHRKTQEWFTVVQGSATLILGDPESGARRELHLSADTPVTVYVPSGVSHVFVNAADATTPMLLVAYADQRYQPDDTIPANLLG
ncbi:MAG TPA: WxcM-like domain-containing protein [Phototrophicaceae bacterium]|nr:WxcM-like domain-containing protein [Phototrophicaceae bacterium]